MLGAIHDAAGLPWWAAIVLVTASARACILPFAAVQQQVAARMQRAAPLLQEAEREFMVAQVAQSVYTFILYIYIVCSW